MTKHTDRSYPRWLNTDTLTKMDGTAIVPNSAPTDSELAKTWPDLSHYALHTENLDVHGRPIANVSHGTLRRSGVRFARYFSNLSHYNNGGLIEATFCFPGHEEYDFTIGRVARHEPLFRVIKRKSLTPLIDGRVSTNDRGIHEVLSMIDGWIVKDLAKGNTTKKEKGDDK